VSDYSVSVLELHDDYYERVSDSMSVPFMSDPLVPYFDMSCADLPNTDMYGNVSRPRLSASDLSDSDVSCSYMQLPRPVSRRRRQGAQQQQQQDGLERAESCT
jgi:hypothetical protein